MIRNTTERQMDRKHKMDEERQIERKACYRMKEKTKKWRKIDREVSKKKGFPNSQKELKRNKREVGTKESFLELKCDRNLG